MRSSPATRSGSSARCRFPCFRVRPSDSPDLTDRARQRSRTPFLAWPVSSKVPCGEQRGCTSPCFRQRPVRLSEMPLTGRELLRLAGADQQPIAGVDQTVCRSAGRSSERRPVPIDPSLGDSRCTDRGLVILDEPTSNMDPRSKGSLEEILNARRMSWLEVCSSSATTTNSWSTSRRAS